MAEADFTRGGGWPISSTLLLCTAAPRWVAAAVFATMLASTVNGTGAGHGGDHGKESGSLLKKVVSNGDLSSVAVNGGGGGPPVKAPWDKKKLGLVRCWHPAERVPALWAMHKGD